MYLNPGTTADDAERLHPQPWWRRKRVYTPLELAAIALEECRRNQLEHTSLSEYHTAMTLMLQKREKRILSDLERLSNKPAAADPV